MLLALSVSARGADVANPDGGTMTGSVIGTQCTSFELHRAAVPPRATGPCSTK
jgi:hypothetical protein